MVDVEILHTIITSAEQNPDVLVHPFRAIFAAYDQILAQHGLDPDHDQIYLRFLLRLGGKRQAGESLYQSFESLLGELGIQIEINKEEEGVQEITRSFNQINEEAELFSAQSDTEFESRVQSRKASVHSVYDTENESIRAEAMRSISQPRAPGPKSSIHEEQKFPDRPYSRASTRPTERPQVRYRPRTDLSKPGGGRLTSQEFINNLQHYQRRNASVSSNVADTRNDQRALSRSGAEVTQPSTSPDHDIYVNPAVVPDAAKYHVRARADNQSQPAPNRKPAPDTDLQALFYRPSATQLLRDADTFQHFRVRAVARHAVSKWRSLGLQARIDHARLDEIAVSRDSGILLRQSFDQWRLKFRIQRQIAETERYFSRLEHRATRARDLYLLGKAFTHWEQCAYEQRIRVAETRRHILSIKYFNAWLEHTTINRQKVRGQGLRKFLEIWKQHYAKNWRNDNKALMTYGHTLMKRGYWSWIWAFYDRRAPLWNQQRLKARYFGKWLGARQNLSQRENQFVQLKEHSTKRKVFTQWLERARMTLNNSRQALSFHNQSVVARSFTSYKLTFKHGPLRRQVSNMRDWRIAGSTFAVFVARFRMEQQSRRVSDLRIMRNAWTNWNDRLRWQTLAHDIDDRVVLQALYKWVILERSVLLQRLSEQRLVQRHLWKLVSRCRERTAELERISDLFRKKQNRRLATSVVGRWRSRLAFLRQEEQVAFGFHAPRVVHDILPLWVARAGHWRKQYRKAEDTDYYFLGTRAIRQWRAAVTEAKRRKIREGYAQVRRKVKMNLARRVITRWRNVTIQNKQMNNTASDINQTRLLHYASSLFDQWRDRHDSLVARNLEIEEDYERRCARRHLELWVQGYRKYEQHSQLASVTAELKTSNIAFGWLHKLHLRIIEIRGREGNAESLRRWYEKRHLQHLLRRWHEKTLHRRHLPATPSSRAIVFSARTKRLALRPKATSIATDAGIRGDDASRLEGWTAFDDGGFDLGEWIPTLEEADNPSTPLPGYLSTPSRRAARARGLVRVSNPSTTPKGTPMSFAARLKGKGGPVMKEGAGLEGSRVQTIREDEGTRSSKDGLREHQG
ncbi:MAG: hypothetical protein LQ351_001252 [Letrouitia transgressa]|nr:MAG: hypothetical protein LQ351_001252 [Letrouitia transgressa]